MLRPKASPLDLCFVFCARAKNLPFVVFPETKIVFCSCCQYLPPGPLGLTNIKSPGKLSSADFDGKEVKQSIWSSQNLVGQMNM